MAKSTTYRTGRHVLFRLHAHLVFVTKFRQGCITERVWGIMLPSFETVCQKFETTLTEANFETDHVHLLVDYPAKVSISALVNSLKGVSARRVRSADLPEVRRALWGKQFWSPSYCAVSCGGAPLETIKRYVRSQQGASSPP